MAGSAEVFVKPLEIPMAEAFASGSLSCAAKNRYNENPSFIRYDI
jgi:hypothetical protein